MLTPPATVGGPELEGRGIANQPYRHRRIKLTPAQREEITLRRRAGETATSLAREFGVSAGYIRDRLS